MINANALGRIMGEPEVLEDNSAEFFLACKQKQGKTDAIKVKLPKHIFKPLENDIKKGIKVYVFGRLNIPAQYIDPYIVASIFEFCEDKKEKGAELIDK